MILKSEKNRYAYIAVADRTNWIPVGWGTIKGKSANFKKVSKNSIYLPVYVSNSDTKPFNYPFTVLPNGLVHYLKPDTTKLQKVELTRKYPLTKLIQIYVDRMIEGKFQGANNKDFKNAVNLYEIKKSPGVYFNDVQINVPNKFRYVRYLSKDWTGCNVAEIEFYEKKDTIPLSGEKFGTKGCSPELAFDKDILTYFDVALDTNQWIGLDLGTPKKITKIRFSARNDKNHIIPGNLYELFYWDNEWKSLNKKVATNHILTYDNVPLNSLLFLKNHTEGKEERIFTYENGKQVWW